MNCLQLLMFRKVALSHKSPSPCLAVAFPETENTLRYNAVCIVTDSFRDSHYLPEFTPPLPPESWTLIYLTLYWLPVPRIWIPMLVVPMTKILYERLKAIYLYIRFAETSIR